MKKPFLLLAILLFCLTSVFAQLPMLVEDYIEGPDGSITGRLFNFHDKIVYQGIAKDGEPAILTYDRQNDMIDVLIQESELEGELRLINATEDQIIIVTVEDFGMNRIYLAKTADLSDLKLIYNSEEFILARLRIYQENIIIHEFNIVEVGYENRIKVIHPDFTVSTLADSMDYFPLGYEISSTNGHFIFAHNSELIDNEFVQAYNVETRTPAPFTDVVPTYEACGFIQVFGIFLEDMLFYGCDESMIYDFNNERMIPVSVPLRFLSAVTNDFLYARNNTTLYQINLNTFETTELITNSNSSTNFPGIDGLDITNGVETQILHRTDYTTGSVTTYETDIPNDSTTLFTLAGVVPSGMHTILHNPNTNNGILVNIGTETMTIIDSVFSVSGINAPLAVEEDIYYMHNDPDVGNELFFLDYTLSSTFAPSATPKISISPNPSRDYIHIKLPQNLEVVQGFIIDQSGRHIKMVKTQMRIDIRDLNVGSYYLKLKLKNHASQVIPFIKI